jgi:DNA-binding SARP family transcriptional activator
VHDDIRINLLGSLDVLINGRRVDIPGQRRKAFLAALALPERRYLTSDALCEYLWGPWKRTT